MIEPRFGSASTSSGISVRFAIEKSQSKSPSWARSRSAFEKLKERFAAWILGRLDPWLAFRQRERLLRQARGPAR